MIFELLFHKEILYILVDDPFDLLVQNLILGSYYIAFAVYLDLKIRYCYKTDIFINKNISPFIVGFCGVLTIFAIFAIFIIKSNTGYLSMRHLIYIIFSLCGQASHYIASKKASKYLAEKTVIAMLFLNITNFVMVSYELISRTSWRFNFSLEN
jgi:fluoride ion exporter CrcB/FEX